MNTGRKYGLTTCAALGWLASASAAWGGFPVLAEPERQFEDEAELAASFPVSYGDDVLDFFPSLPESAWLTREQRRAVNALEASGPWELIVPPFSIDAAGFDRVERTMAARLLAAHIARTTNLRVADPGLVAQALGSTRRRLKDAELFKLAKRLDAKFVIDGHMGHDQQGKFGYAVELHTLESGLVSTRTLENVQGIEFDDINLPHAIFAEAVPAIATHLTGSAAKNVTKASVVRRLLADMPENMQDLKALAYTSPLHEALYLEFLAELVPDSTSLIRRHLFERALIALQLASADSVYYDVIKARALYGLYRRPAAVASLSKTKSAAGKALLAAMNGDLPGLKTHIEGVDQAVLRLFAEFDLETMRRNYGFRKNDERATELAEASGDWGLLVYRRFTKDDTWGNFSHTWTKLSLETLAPDDGVSLEAVINAAQIEMRDLTEVDIAKLTLDHVDAAIKRKGADWLLDQKSITFPTEVDLLEIGSEITQENAFARIYALVQQKGLPEDGLRLAQDYERLFSGHPEFTEIHALALTALSRQKQGGEEAALKAEAQSKGKLAFELMGEQRDFNNNISKYPQHFYPAAKKLTPAQRNAVFYWADYPTRFFSLMGKWPKPLAVEAKRCLAYTTFYTSCVVLYQKNVITPDAFDSEKSFRRAADDFLAYLDSRFVGAPGMLELRAKTLELLGDKNGRKKTYLAAIDDESLDWKVYRDIGFEFANEGNVEKAAKVFSSFPGFNGADEFEAITLGNYAFEAGTKLFFAGAYEEAEEFYAIAAQDNSGSNANMSSAIRLLLVGGEFEAAIAATADRVRRYQSKWAYRDLIAMLNALGETASAWSLFDAVNAGMKEPQIWVGALTGHRREGATLSEVADWLERNGRKLSHDGSLSLAGRYLFLAGSLDRKVDKELASLMAQLDAEQKPMVLQGRIEIGRDRVGPESYSISGGGDRPAEREVAPKGRLQFAAEAMAYFQAGEFAKARLKFVDMSRWYKLEEFRSYFAWASAQSGNTKRVDEYIDAWSKSTDFRATEDCNNCRFDGQLILAMLSGARNEHKDALDYLTRALADRPYTERRSVYTYYQVLEAAEILYQKSGYEPYRAFLLDKAKRFTRIQPMYSWAYAMVALHTSDAQERVMYLATALHLDPNSWRSSQIDASTRETAQRWLEKYSPLYLRKDLFAGAMSL